MKTNLPPALMELINDTEAHRVEEQMLALARGIRSDGVGARFVIRGLAGAICTLIDEDYLKSDENFVWSKQILWELKDGFTRWHASLELIDDLADEVERSRAAGGTGSAFQ
jgi:hypothetical protein